MKIAICGTGAGFEKAPFNTDWEVWGLPGHYNTGAKFDEVYEIHSAQTLMELRYPVDKQEWMRCVSVIHPTLAGVFPEARVIDFEGLINKYGRIFSSSLAWMLAEAIEKKPKEIAIYGVTMSSEGEYAHQKPSCAYLIGWAKALGIKVTTQKENALLSVPFQYGYEEIPDLIKDMRDKKKIIRNEIARADNEVMEATGRYHHNKGVLETFEYFENNYWAASKNV